MVSHNLTCEVLLILLVLAPLSGYGVHFEERADGFKEGKPKDVESPRSEPKTMSSNTVVQKKTVGGGAPSPTLQNFATQKSLMEFKRFYAEDDLSDYAYLNRTNLINQIYDPLGFNYMDSYVSDIKIDQGGKLLVLGGMDLCTTSDKTFPLTKSAYGTEKSTTSWANACFVGFMLRYTKDFSLESGTVIDSPKNDNATFSTLELDTSGNIYVLGTVGPVVTEGNLDNPRTNNTDVFVMKFDSTFSFINQTIIGGDYLERAGAKASPAFYFYDDSRRFVADDLLEIDSSGDIVIAGSTTSFSDAVITEFPVVEPAGGTNDPTWNLKPSPLGENAFVVKLDSNLNVKWSRMFTGTSTTASEERVGALTIGPDDKIYIGGSTTSDSLPHGLVYPLNDTATNGETAVNHQRTNANFGVGNTKDAFIAVFEPNGTLHTSTYVGSSAGEHDGIYAMAVDSNNILYVAGEVQGGAGTFPVISPIESDPGYSETIYDKYPWTGFLLTFDTNDYNITFSHRFVQGNASAITDLQVVGDEVYYSGVASYSYFSNLTVLITPGYAYSEGHYQDNSFSIGFGNYIEKDYSASFVGLLNSSERVTYQTFTDFGEDTLLKSPLNISLSTSEATATSRSPIVVDLNNSDIYVGLDNYFGTHLKKLSVNDTDGDGLSDWNEIYKYGTDPSAPDTDGDEIIDGLEVYGFNDYSWPSNPLDEDTDDDCINDNIEILNGLNPAVPDTGVDLDGDGLSSWDEYKLGLNITNPDTDGDGLTDFEEVFVTYTNGSNPDTDSDTLGDKEEYLMGWDPNDPDMDDDGLTDGQEYNLTYVNATGQPDRTDPFNPDTDLDGLIDGLEYVLYTEGYASNKTNPLLYDSDGDGLSDYDEYMIFATTPYNADMDGDGLNDTEELLIYFTNVTNPDTDGDGFTDGQEVKTNTVKTDPVLWDTDNDTLSDYEEIITYSTDPLDPDVDQDGLWDADELAFGSDPYNNDTDGDLLPDLWEYQMGLKSNVTETYTDPDGDNMTTLMEYYNNTHPLYADIDGDGLADPVELSLGTDPWVNDTDSDGLDDGFEVSFGTSPLRNDTDGDLLSDKWEYENGYNATNADMDSDGLFDGSEVALGTDPYNNDTDSDGLVDGQEVFYSSDPFDNDTDNDTLTDGDEVFKYFTSPVSEDTDDDGITDDKELKLGTTPYDPDTDDDQLNDGKELLLSSDPLNNDTDSDTLLDGVEVWVYGTSPTLNDTDGDGLPDPWEVKYMVVGNTKYLDPKLDDADEDPDDDGLTNLEEYQIGTDPTNPDTDGDGGEDGWEVEQKNRDPLDPSDKYKGDYIREVQEGMKANPALAFTGIAVIIGATLIFFKMIFDSLRWRRRK